jgi:DNA processing protein
MALEPDLEPWLVLSLARGLSADNFRRLLVAFRSPAAILSAARAELARVVPAEAAAAVEKGTPRAQLDTVAAWLEDPSNRVLTLADSAYPQALLQIPDPPPLLYAKGRVERLNAPSFAVVGSRNATQAGMMQAEAFARALSDAGLLIVSGLALGIDAAAHRGGLAGRSSTLAIVGTGLDIVYPARNRELAHAIARAGCIASEFALGTPPAAENFPRRNRLISGVARGCLVVEAALSSGSLITARLANEQGKDVFAMPGSIHSPLAKGCHRLIKQGAKLVESAEDILEELQLPAVRGVARAESDSDESAHPILQALGFDPCDFDSLLARAGVSADTLAALLTQWEIDGVVETLPGGRYQRVR